MNIQLRAIIKDTVLKELRNKTLIFVVISTTFIVLLSNLLLKLFLNLLLSNNGDFQINGSNPLSLMIFFINSWSLIIAGIFGTSSIRSDFNNDVIYQYLSFPISRIEYMWGRIIGTFLIVFVYYLYSYLFAGILFSITTSSFAISWTHLLSLFLMSLYIFLVVYMSYLLSMYFNRLGAFLILITVVVMIYFSATEFRSIEFTNYFSNIGIFKILGLLTYLFLPRICYITEISSEVLIGSGIKLNVYLELVHLLLTSSVLIYFGMKLMKKKDF